ncbi:MAG: CpaF family protein [Planctomycetes bacterium]|nr:CpaF family protein [Planctomycetota bacterium]
MISLLIQAPGKASRRVKVTSNLYRIGGGSGNHIKLDGLESYGCIVELHIADGDQAKLRRRQDALNVTVNGKSLEQEHQLRSGDRTVIDQYTIVFQQKNASVSVAAEPQTVVPKAVRPATTARKAPRPQAPQSQSAKPKNTRYFTLQKLLHEELLENLDLKHLDVSRFSEKEMKDKSRKTLEGIMAELDKSQFRGININELVTDVIDQALGLGPLEELLKQEDITEIMVNNFDQIYVERKGKLTLSGTQFVDNAAVIEVIRRIIAPIGRRIDETNPMVDARLQDGSRVNAIIPPLAISGPSITIRKFATDPFQIEDLIQFGSLTAQMAEFLSVCVEQRKNICISGGTGSGKTTLLGVIAAYIPNDDRIVTIEDAAELKLPQEHKVSLESKPPNLEGKGAIPIRKLVINSLRMRPDRIIVGECRGAEALDMLQAMNTGHDGSLTTLHANTCRDAIARLETMVMMAGMNLPSKAITEQISSAVDVIVQTNRYPDGTRKISSISVLVGMEGDKITLQEIFAYKMNGYDEDGKVLGEYTAEGGIPAFYRELQERGIDVDISIFR